VYLPVKTQLTNGVHFIKACFIIQCTLMKYAAI